MTDLPRNYHPHKRFTVAKMRKIKNYRSMPKEELLIVLLKSNQIITKLCRSKNNNAEIEETKKMFNEQRNNLKNKELKKEFKKIRRKVRLRDKIDDYLKELEKKIV